MSGPSTYVPKSAIGRWFESRLPLMGLVHSSFMAYPVPRNLNYMWTFGAILVIHADRADHHRRRACDALHPVGDAKRSCRSTMASCGTSTTAG